MSTRITCLSCDGTGSANNPSSFNDEGKAPEAASINCDVCKGQGFIEVDNPEGIRVAVLVAKKICAQYPQFKSWEEVYRAIVANISNGVNAGISSARLKQSIDLSFDDDTVFSEDSLPIDAVLEKWIDKGNYIEEAKTILGIKNK